MNHRHVGIAGTWMALLISAPAVADDVHPAMLRDWERSWERLVFVAVERYLQRASANEFANLEPKDKRWALEELRAVVEPAISWDVLGDTFIANMQDHCGYGILEQVTPLYAGEVEQSEMDQTVVRQYAVCAQQASALTAREMDNAVAAVSGEIEAIHRKYGAK